MQIFPTSMCIVTAWRHSILRAHWLIALVGGGGAEGERSMYSAFPGNCSVSSYLSFVYGRSLWAELNGGENSLHWKANMLPLFSIMTLWLEGSSVVRRGTLLRPWIASNLRQKLVWGHNEQLLGVKMVIRWRIGVKMVITHKVVKWS